MGMGEIIAYILIKIDSVEVILPSDEMMMATL